MNSINDINLAIQISDLIKEDIVKLKLFAVPEDAKLDGNPLDLFKQSLNGTGMEELIPYVGKYLDIKLARKYFKISYLTEFPTDFIFLGKFGVNAVFFQNGSKKSRLGFKHLLFFSIKDFKNI